MVRIKIASNEDVRTLSGKLTALVDNRGSQIYRENVTKFGIPDDYVLRAFSVEAFTEALSEGSIFYLVLNGNEVLGFAQTLPADHLIVELDRIIIFPQHVRKGIGSALLEYIVRDQRERGVSAIRANAGRNETHARAFYEKNGFRKIKDLTLDAPWGGKLELVLYRLELKKGPEHS